MTVSDPLLGHVLDGKYRLDAPLGRGGMGTVYRATQLALERIVAVKVIRGDFRGDGASVERFKREALAIARLKHPHIVTIHDFGVAPDAGVFLVVEFLEGRTLRWEIERRDHIPLGEAVPLMQQVLSAVDAAHAAGVVHRDLKPDNIFLESTSRGTVAKVLDFGIAKLDEPGGGARELTMAGMLLGTPLYMSPEQCRGEATDARSDVYALGCVLYEMLTGQPPFIAQTVTAVLTKHVSEPAVPPSQNILDLPPEADAVLLRAMAKRPEDRYQTASEFARALGDLGFTDTRLLATPRAGPPIDTAATILDGRGGLATDASPDSPKTRKMGPNNLPLAMTSFVGRRTEVGEVNRLLSEARLVTLTGPGGIGKTRLALEVAAGLLDTHRDGVWFVELAPLTDSLLVPQAVASTLDVREEAGQPLLTTLTRSLAPKSVLLVLDNCEHVIDGCAGLADAVLRACPAARILATSREALALSGEAVWPVPALSLPDPEAAPAEEVSRYEAVQLFLERARATSPGFAPTERNAGVIASLCARLDGIPLAIELAAARVKVLSPEQILARLEDRFRLLTGGNRLGQPRQRTLRAAIDWSYELLTGEERLLLQRLSVFAGGWTLEAAEAVCSEEGGRREETESDVHPDHTHRAVSCPSLLPPPSSLLPSDVLDLLTRLVDKSLVIVDRRGDEVRYRLLETIRQYAGEKLGESGEKARTAGRYRDWFVRWAEQARRELDGPEAGEWLARFEAEHDNLRAVLEGEALGGAPDEGLRLSGALGAFWARRGYVSEGRRWLEAALARGPAAPAEARGRALHWAGVMAFLQSDYESARELLESALPARRDGDDAQGLSRTLSVLGQLMVAMGDYETAMRLSEESLALARALGDPQAIAMAGANVGRVALDRGDLERAQECYRDSLAIFRDHENRRTVAVMLQLLAEVTQYREDYAQAKQYAEEGLEIARGLDDKILIPGLSQILGAVATAQGEYGRALALLKDALRIFRELDERDDMVNALENIASALAARGESERALRLAASASEIRKRLNSVRSPIEQARLDRYLDAARRGLSAGEADRAAAEGSALSLEDAVRDALASP